MKSKQALIEQSWGAKSGWDEQKKLLLKEVQNMQDEKGGKVFDQFV